jgi:hypothetical protein
MSSNCKSLGADQFISTALFPTIIMAQSEAQILEEISRLSGKMPSVSISVVSDILARRYQST